MTNALMAAAMVEALAMAVAMAMAMVMAMAVAMAVALAMAMALAVAVVMAMATVVAMALVMAMAVVMAMALVMAMATVVVMAVAMAMAVVVAMLNKQREERSNVSTDSIVKVSPEEYFGRDTWREQPTVNLTPSQLFNACRLLVQINRLRDALGVPLLVTSGYRTPEHNAKIGGAPKSNHMQCLAVDISDPDGKLKSRLAANDCYLLRRFGLYMEDPNDTPTWCHLQIVPPASGRRIFGR